MKIDAFNGQSPEAATATVLAWADVPGWAAAVAAARPFVDVGALLMFAERTASSWTAGDLDHALARHPRIGERAPSTSPDAAQSLREQSVSATSGAEEADALRAGNAEYERRFGRVFLVRAAGRSAAEILGELNRRLRNDPETETGVALDALREIAILRARRLFDEPPATSATTTVSTHILDSALGRPAPDVLVVLRDAGGAELGRARTDADGRARLFEGELAAASVLTLTFSTGDYFAAQSHETFYPTVTIDFSAQVGGRYHVPLLLSPFAYSTYRGS